jgi:MFS family permease
LKKNFIFLALGFFFYMLSFATFDLLPKHFLSLGFLEEETGYIMGMFGLGGISILPILVLIIDKFKSSTLLRSTLGGFIILNSFYLIPTQNINFFAVLRFSQGILATTMMISVTTALSHVVTAGKQRSRFALFGIMGQIPTILSMVLGESILNNYSIRGLVLFSYALILASFVFYILFNDGFHPEENSVKLSQLFPQFTKTSNLPIFYWIFILGITLGTIQTFLPEVIEARGLTEVSLFYVSFPLTVISIRLLTVNWLDRFSPHIIYGLPLLFLPLSLISIYFIQGYEYLLGSGMVYGTAHAFLFPMLTAGLVMHAPANLRGRMSLLFQVFFNLGLFFTSFFGGIIFTNFGENNFFLFTISIVSAGFIIYLATHKLQKTSE